MEAQGSAVGKASTEGLPRVLLAVHPALPLLGWPPASPTTSGLGQALLPGAWPVASPRLSLALCPPCWGDAPTRQVTHSPSS